MNSSPEITIISTPSPTTEKATVREMFLLYDLVAKAALDAGKLRRAFSACTPEQRAFLHTFFVGVATTK